MISSVDRNGDGNVNFKGTTWSITYKRKSTKTKEGASPQTRGGLLFSSSPCTAIFWE
ncbi:uncharacterized protein J3R85_017759 [Psidium guajava]|nr:uncharacterized protein J3R85_017759 [Psidium guajava]